MNLIGLEFRKHLVQFRVPLIMFGAALVLDLALAQEWLGVEVWTYPFASGPKLLSLFVWPMTLVLPVIMLMESPNWNAFAQTRPISLRELWFGKWLFLGLVVIIPLIMQEALHLWLADQPADVIGAGVWERATLLIPAALFIGALTGTTNNPKEFGVAFIGLYGSVILGICMVVGGGWVLSQILGEPVFDDPEPDALVLRIVLSYAAVTCAIIAWLNIRYELATRARWALLMLAGVAVPFVSLLSPRLPDVQALEQDLVTMSSENITPRYPLGAVSVASFDSPDKSLTGFTVTLRPKLEALPEDWILTWQHRLSVFTPTEGVPLKNDRRGTSSDAFEQLNGNLTQEDVRNILKILKPGTVMQRSHSGFSAKTVSCGPFFTEAIGADTSVEGTVAVDSKATVFRWSKAAELDIKLLASAEDKIGRWHLAGLHQTEASLNLVVKREQTFLELSTRQHERDIRSWPRARYAFVLYNPIAGVARMQESSIWANSNVGQHTGYQRRSMIMKFNNAENLPFDLSDNANLKLLIFRLDYLGSFDKRLTADIRLRDISRHHVQENRIRDDKLDAVEFERRVAALDAPATDASRAEVGAYVYQILRLTDLRDRRLDSDDAVATLLASYVPNHLEVFLDGLESADSRASRVLHGAINTGITERQKATIIARLHRNPKLAEVLLKHGWHLDAREELFALLTRHDYLPHAALRALAGFDDPRVVKHFSEELGTTSNVNVYQMMRRQPHLRAEADRVVNELWKKRVWVQTVHHSVDDSLKLAIMHGLPDALQAALAEFRLLSRKERESAWGLINLIRDNVQLPIKYGDRYDHKKVGAAILATMDSTFRYDPIRGRFIPVTQQN
jgi:hypothetical protein